MKRDRPTSTEAIALDPYFTRAYWVAGNGALFNQGKWGSIDSLVGVMNRAIEPMTVADRAVRDAMAAMVRGDVLSVYRASAGLAEVVPYGATWFLQGFFALGANYPGIAVESQLKVVDSGSRFAREFFFVWTILNEGLHLLGDHERELEMARRAEGYIEPQFTLPYLITSFAALGQVSEVNRFVEEMLNAEALGLGSAVDGARELRRHGHRQASDSLLGRVVDILRQRRPRAFVLFDALTMLGRNEEAKAVIEGMRRDSMNIRLIGGLGYVYALTGDRPSAEKIAGDLAVHPRRHLLGSNTFWRARIAAALGEKARAMSLLRAAFAEGLTIPAPQSLRSWLHADPAFEILWDYEPYLGFMRPKG